MIEPMIEVNPSTYWLSAFVTGFTSGALAAIIVMHIDKVINGLGGTTDD